MAKLTSRTLATGASLNDLIHIVITGDTSQSIDGSSYKATLSQVLPLFGGTSGNCITSFYTNNIYACTNEITVHNRVQSTGSDAQNTLSFAFGSNVQALSDYSHAEGVDTIASGDTSHAEGLGTLAVGRASHAEGRETLAIGFYSHAEGYRTLAGTNKGYLATGLTAGVIYLSSSYGDITTEYTSDDYVYINDVSYANTLTETYKKVSGATFNGSQTIIYLYDISTSTSSFAVVGDTGPVSTWNGNQNVGGYVSNTKGSSTAALGDFSMSVNETNNALSKSSFAQGKGNTVFGINSCVFNNNNYVVGTNSASFGSVNLIEGAVSFILGASNIIKSDDSFVGGRNNVSEGLQSFIFSYQSVVNSEKGAILGGSQNFIESGNTNYNTILGGESNTITGLSPSDPVYDSSIIGGSGNTVQSYSSVIVGGEGNYISGSRSVIIGGSGMTKSQSDTVYVPKFTISFSGTPLSSADTQGDPGSIMWDNTYLYYKDNTGWKRLSGATF